jgi:hypothetical protein
MKRSLLILCILSFIVMDCGCIAGDQNVLPPGKYVALQEEVRDSGTFISGHYPYPGMAQPMWPFYYGGHALPPDGYPPNYPPLNDSLKILLGSYGIKESNISLTVSLNVAGVYELPYTLEPDLKIIGVERNGTVTMSYGNESITLPPGSAWKSPAISTWNETGTVRYPPPGAMTGYDNGTEYTYTVQYVRTLTVINKGVFDK